MATTHRCAGLMMNAPSLRDLTLLREGAIVVTVLACAVLASAGAAGAGEAGGGDEGIATHPIAPLPPHARLALCGDSITEQMLYTTYIEAYLLACAGRTDVSVFQFGWGGENADQFSNRIRRGDLDAFRPTAVTFLYGANDAGGMAWQDWMTPAWNGRVGAILDSLARRYPATVGATVICGPTCFDLNREGSNGAAVAVSNDDLERFREMNLAMAQARGVGFADVHARMARSATAAHAADPGYHFGGSDGVHAGPNGQLMIAHEILRALHCDGAIATITVDMNGGAVASAGEQVVSAHDGVVELDSTRWPFCTSFNASAASTPPGETLASVLPYLPFDQDLNRFVLVVRHLGAAHANVTWGGEVHRFRRAELERGVNLAAAFAHTPCDDAFAHLMELIAVQQAQEEKMIKAARDATAPDKGWTAADVVARDALDQGVHDAVRAVRSTLTVADAGAAGTSAPVVSSASAAAVVGQAFSFAIGAVNDPDRYSVAGNLPAGLKLDPDSGVIAGTPTAAGHRRIVLLAQNSAGRGEGVLDLTVNAAVATPVVTSALTVAGTVGAPLSYRITATQAPTHFFATGLPAGLNVDAASGVISGTPGAAGSTAVMISGENAGGNGVAVTLRIDISANR
jgi:hypothetical protein